MTPSQTELKPCPFCGEKNIIDMGMIKGCGVSCPNDGCAAYMANVPILKWNTRPSLPQQDQLLELYLCEYPHLLLKPNQLYRFIVDGKCAKCNQMAIDANPIIQQVLKAK